MTAFFVALGLEVEGRTFVEGEFLDTVCGIPDSRTEIVMLKPPDDGTRLELSSFVRPDSVPGSPAAMANELGLRNVAFEVNDLQAAVDWAATEGYGLVGGIGEYEGAWRMAYVRGPEGITSRWPSASADLRNARICRQGLLLSGPGVLPLPTFRSPAWTEPVEERPGRSSPEIPKRRGLEVPTSEVDALSCLLGPTPPSLREREAECLRRVPPEAKW